MDLWGHWRQGSRDSYICSCFVPLRCSRYCWREESTKCRCSTATRNNQFIYIETSAKFVLIRNHFANFRRFLLFGLSVSTSELLKCFKILDEHSNKYSYIWFWQQTYTHIGHRKFGQYLIINCETMASKGMVDFHKALMLLTRAMGCFQCLPTKETYIKKDLHMGIQAKSRAPT